MNKNVFFFVHFPFILSDSSTSPLLPLSIILVDYLCMHVCLIFVHHLQLLLIFFVFYYFFWCCVC